MILALAMVDNTDNHIYFSHKYKISNNLKEYLNFFHEYFYETKKNKKFFKEEIKKNIFYHGKNKILSLAKFYFISNSKKNYQELDDILNKIHSTNIPIFPITGNYLIEQGIKSGKRIGEVLKKIEKKWVENDFKLKEEDLKNLINKYN